MLVLSLMILVMSLFVLIMSLSQTGRSPERGSTTVRLVRIG